MDLVLNFIPDRPTGDRVSFFSALFRIPGHRGKKARSSAAKYLNHFLLPTP
ncbi:hypothetical protein QUB70_13850 [Microcoleus sp. A003_D6]|uniref:hypothetical protein n=1 Tax=Microcoleus sp. A003_D6 TaxID=3055266 RepID=UPI002FCF9471